MSDMLASKFLLCKFVWNASQTGYFQAKLNRVSGTAGQVYSVQVSFRQYHMKLQVNFYVIQFSGFFATFSVVFLGPLVSKFHV